MNILVIGAGGREHALAWKLAQSPKVQMVYVAPGNGGTATDARMKNLPITDVMELREWAQANKIGLTLVGPEGPLAAGVVDAFRAQGMRIFGPTKAAAQLESSKAFSKAFMRRHSIPTAEYATFSDPVAAHAYVSKMGAPTVVKADGLAAGKGVVVAMTEQEAHDAIDFMLVDNTLGVTHVVPLATSQDHKRLQDADQGPNTGGMGAYSPAPVVTPEVHARAMREVISPTIRGMERDGIPFTGFLYAGLMIDAQGHIKTLEFNCRMGDPETQPIMMRLKTDLVDVMWAATEPGPHGKLDSVELQWDRRAALGVVLAAPGYPMNPRKGDAITGIAPHSDDCAVFHAGTVLQGETLQTSGGRVLCVTALADSVRLAQQKAYHAIKDIHFDGMQYRTDIGFRAVKAA
jgi:phosphoribosylamine--glycine ligase